MKDTGDMAAWIRAIMPAVLTGAIAVFALKIDMVRMEEKLINIEQLVNGGILPGAVKADTEMRGDLRLMGQRLSSDKSEIHRSFKQYDDRFEIFSVRLRNLETKFTNMGQKQ